jgi:bacteriocin biosynthesis cyclodehydratase domain-containing protein
MPASPVQILSLGAFGRAVAKYLKMTRLDVVETCLDEPAMRDPEAWPVARINVIAAWRPVMDICEWLDQVCHERQRPFIPLIVDSRILCLGPVVVPRSGSCWNCWIQRSRQHARSLNRRRAVWEHYMRHASAGPHGYLEPFALMGAARVSQAIQALDAHVDLGGQLWQIDMLTRAIITSTVIGVDDCPRCGLHRPLATRSFAEMQKALAYLWSQDSTATNR